MPMLSTSRAPEAGHRGWHWHLGIRGQLLALLLPGVALLLAVDSWSDYHTLTRAVEHTYDEALLEPLSALDASMRVDSRSGTMPAAPVSTQAMFEALQVRHQQLHVGLAPLAPEAGVAPSEQTLMGVSDLPAPPAGAEPAPLPAGFGAAPSARIIYYDADYHGHPVRVAALERELRDPAGHRYRLLVQAAESTGRRIETREAALRRELWQDSRMLLVTALLVWLGVSLALRPLERLRASMLQRPAHDLQPLDPSGVPREVVPLVDAVNHHIADHRTMLADQGRFLADASHQLRTPLAIMMTQAGYALRERDTQLLRETLRAIITQLARSRRLSDQLLAMAHAGRALNEAESAQLVDLNAVAREVVLQYLPLAHEKNQDLGWSDVRGEDAHDTAIADAPAAPVRAQAVELHESLANLLHNAIRHTPAGGSITVAVRIEGDSAVAEVCDDGPGILPEQREGAFVRFRRGGANELQGGTGAGLGLAIARAYARRNGGDITLEDGRQGRPGGPGGPSGLCARLRLPLAAAPEA